MNQKKERILTGANSVFVVIITIAIAIILNVIVSQNTITFDLTDNQIYTLSPASKDAVKNLKGDIVVKAYISPDMPPPLHTLTQSIDDLLKDYAAASNGKLTYQIISPEGDDNEAEEDARGYGIEKVGIGQRSDDEVSLRAVYKGVAFVMGDKTETIKELRTTGNAEIDNFEYEFTKALLNLRSSEPQRIAFLAGFGGPASEPAFLQSVQPMFDQLYGNLLEVSVIDLSDRNTTIPENVNALIILNLEENVNEKAKFELDQYLQRGGSVGWYQSASGPDIEMMRRIAQKIGAQGQLPDVRKTYEIGLHSFFNSMGFDVQKDVILDREKGLAMGYIRTDKGIVQVSHPATFLLEDLDRSLPFMGVLPGLVLPAPSSIIVSEKLKSSDDIQIYEIAKTGPTSVRRSTPPETLNYKQFITPTPDETKGPFVVAVAAQGKFPSYFENNALPEGIDESSLVKNKDAEGRILLVGSGDFFLPNPQIGFSDQLAGLGGQFLLSSIEWLAQNGALGEIRGKKAPRLVGEIPKDIQQRIQFANIVAVPSIFGLLGYMFFILRRRRKEIFRLKDS